jgi:probable rRNA maturation factor
MLMDDDEAANSTLAHRAGVGALVELVDAGRSLAAGSRERLAADLGAALVWLGTTGEVRIRLVGDLEMAAAHKKHLGDATTTDVLTFDLAEAGRADVRALDVDLLLCVDEARRQGAQRGHTVERELLLYSLHGVLHCLGYDDHDEEGYRRMHEREDEVLAAIGVGATFDVSPSSGPRGSSPGDLP